MPPTFLETPIEFLKGVGPQRGEALNKELGIFTFGDLLAYYPYRYIDRGKFHKVNEVFADSPEVQLKGFISNIRFTGNNRMLRMNAVFSDDTGSLELVWFNGVKWLKDKFKPGIQYVIFGKPSLFNHVINIMHPEVEAVSEMDILPLASLQPMYNSSEKLKIKGLDSKGIWKLQKILSPQIAGKIYETLSEKILKSTKLISREQALMNLHMPQSQELLLKARNRLKFEELFFMQLRLHRDKQIRVKKASNIIFEKVGDYFNDFYTNYLTFPLTNAQKRVIKEIRKDTGSGSQMSRMLQGDVGSGKTIVALMSMLLAIDNGFQACMMAPTEILAMQHAKSIQKFLKNTDLKIVLLTGAIKGKPRKKILEDLASGEVDVLIGTHALIENTVVFKNLGFAVIDEQHRFGVMQRAKLWEKNENPPHILLMTATPIPRTLAMTLYGDLDVSILDEMPPGRKPVKTIHYRETHRQIVFGFMKQQIKLGRQIYVVYPLINESETLDLKDLMEGYDSIIREFPLPEFAISIVHGQMKTAEKDYEMQRFVKGETNIMVATTVIEVGVDVANASVMIIENAERFGLSQLHQLRGRVGRGADQSYCILMSGDKVTTDARQRIATMVETTDGFRIAEADLRLRGPGDLEGTQQSGILDLKIADIVHDEKILIFARKMAAEIIEADPDLSTDENYRLNLRLRELCQSKIHLAKVG
jgi:ATP-dependent DNA helicase RecG